MAVLGIVVVEAATASCTQEANSGSGALGPVGSASGAASWNASNHHFTLHAAADSVLASGICADAWYDWLTVGGHHYDARVARTCQAGSTRYADGTDGYTEPSNSVSVRSMQKFSVCRSNGADMQNELLECHDSGCAYQGAEGNVIPNRRAAHDAGWSLWVARSRNSELIMQLSSPRKRPAGRRSSRKPMPALGRRWFPKPPTP